MIKRSNKFIRDARGTMVLSDADAKKVMKISSLRTVSGRVPGI